VTHVTHRFSIHRLNRHDDAGSIAVTIDNSVGARQNASGAPQNFTVYAICAVATTVG